MIRLLFDLEVGRVPQHPPGEFVVEPVLVYAEGHVGFGDGDVGSALRDFEPRALQVPGAFPWLSVRPLRGMHPLPGHRLCGSLERVPDFAVAALRRRVRPKVRALLVDVVLRWIRAGLPVLDDVRLRPGELWVVHPPWVVQLHPASKREFPVLIVGRAGETFG